MKTFYRKTLGGFLFGLFALAGLPVMAQSPSGQLTQQDFLILGILGLVLLVAILVLLVAAYLVIVLKTIVKNEQAKVVGEGKFETASAAIIDKKPGLWERINNKLTAAVPVEKEETVMLDHDYDGIKELDNHLPPWWKWLFAITVVIGILYLIGYHVIDYFPLQDQEYAMEIAEADEMQSRLANSGAVETIDVSNPVKNDNPDVIANGKSVYNVNCASCHAPDGGGGIGPNLTDEYWLHGSSFKSIFTTIHDGVSGTSMIAWKNVLSPVQVRDVSSYITTLAGTTPASPKESEGEVFTPEEPLAPADTTSQSKSITQIMAQ